MSFTAWLLRNSPSMKMTKRGWCQHRKIQESLGYATLREILWLSNRKVKVEIKLAKKFWRVLMIFLRNSIEIDPILKLGESKVEKIPERKMTIFQVLLRATRSRRKSLISRTMNLSKSVWQSTVLKSSQIRVKLPLKVCASISTLGTKIALKLMRCAKKMKRP